MKKMLLSFVAAAGCAATCAASENLAPHLETRHGVRQLIVDGQPFLILGGELHNSSSSSSNYMEAVWPRLVEKHLNTVLAAVSWEMIEPEEGQFDFSTVDSVIQGARQYRMHLVFLWFGSWKNGLSSYPPRWVKTDPKRFPPAEDQNGHALNILSTFGDATRNADAEAFAALMRHIRKVDGRQHTVLMMQVENEVGVRGDSRDRSPAANAAYDAPVPQALMNYLAQNKATLAPELLQVWAANGNQNSGTWAEVFGPGKPASAQLFGPGVTDDKTNLLWRQVSWASDEFFMAWRYSIYVNKVAAAGKQEYDLPMYCNAWQQQPGFPRPGEYPSGGPVPQVNDLWRFGAPNLDFLSPDLYLPQFDWDCERYTRNGNPLFIPEANTGRDSGANAVTALLKFNGIGFSPFGIDGGFRPRRDDTNTAPADPLPETYAALDYLAPDILADQGREMIAFLAPPDGTNDPAQDVTLGEYRLHITFGGDRPSTNGNFRRFSSPPPSSSLFPSRLVIASGPDGYIFVGAGMNATFTPTTPGAQTVRYASFDEAMLRDGRWVPGRRLNGDETDHDQRWPFLMRGFSILRVGVYRGD